MRQVSLGVDDITVSRFIFGTASLFNVKGGSEARTRLLQAAADHGFTHFDTAPLYGFGTAERDLAKAFATRPDVTVTTKVGLYAPGGEDQAEAVVFARKAAGKALPALSRAISDMSLGRARRSVEGSLRRLGRERIDILMLHEPDARVLATDEWVRWLEGLKSEGKIGAFGIAADDVQLKPFLRDPGPLTTLVQTTDSLDLREADALQALGRRLQITYGYASAAQQRERGRSVTDVLTAALQRNSDGALIVSTRREDRLGQYAALLDVAA